MESELGCQATEKTTGFCLWFTGLSGSGKTTTAEIVKHSLECLGRKVTLLDGDIVREHLTSELGFSKDDRNKNVTRVGYVASQIVYHDGIVLCSLISPYRKSRNALRSMFPAGRFLEIYVDTPLETCEERDPKGHYRKARSGLMKSFTGIDDPYEAPLDPDIRLDTVNSSSLANANLIVKNLQKKKFID